MVLRVLGADSRECNRLATAYRADHRRASQLLAGRRGWRDLRTDERRIAIQFMTGVGLAHPTNMVRHGITVDRRTDISVTSSGERWPDTYPGGLLVTSQNALGPIWDHTFYALLNDLHVHARSATLE